VLLKENQSMKKYIKLKNAMDALLNIYNLNFSEKKYNDWPWKKIKRYLLSFVNSIFDPVESRCAYLIKDKKLNLVIDIGIKNISLPGIEIDKEEIRILIDVFDLLKQEADRSIIHFAIKKLNTHTNIVRDEVYSDSFFKSDPQILYELFERHLLPQIKKSDDKNTELFKKLDLFLETEPVNMDKIILLIRKIIKHNNVSGEDALILIDELKSVKRYLYNRAVDEFLFKEMKKISFNAIKTDKAVNIKHNYSSLNAQSYSLITVEPSSLFAQKLIDSCNDQRQL